MLTMCYYVLCFVHDIVLYMMLELQLGVWLYPPIKHCLYVCQDVVLRAR